MKLFKKLLIGIVAIFYGLIKTIMFIPINLGYILNDEENEKRWHELYKKLNKLEKKKKKFKYLYRHYLLCVFIGLIGTIIMIPITFFICTEDIIKNRFEWEKKQEKKKEKRKEKKKRK